MILLKTFFAMLQFFTRIPINANISLDKEEFGKGLIFAPLIGLIIGCYLWVLNFGLQFIFPPSMTAVFIIIGYILITGGLHLDGLGDTFDGIYSNRPKEQILEIMRDSRVGTNAVLGIFIILIINYATLNNFSNDFIGRALILMPVAGRIGSIVGAGLYTYARVGEGLGKTFVDFCTKKEIFIGYILAMIVFYSVLGPLGILVSIIPLISSIIISKLFTRKIGGITGDLLGAICEVNQSIFLIAFYLISSFNNTLL